MIRSVTAAQQAGYLPLLQCRFCRRRLLEVHVDGIRRTYQCGSGCRKQPIDGDWLDDQIHRALAGKIALHRAAEAIETISLGAADPTGVRVLWRRIFPTQPQPTATTRPTTVFRPANILRS
jgi:hypothetical protein